MKHLIFPAALLSIVLLVASCGDKHPPEPQPEPEKQYSTWIVNGTDTFSTNNVGYSINKSGTYLVSSGTDNSFAFYNLGVGNVAYNAFSPGIHLLSPEINNGNPELLRAFFIYNDVRYTPMPNHNDTIEVLYVNEKVRYELYPSWFVSGNNAHDSIMISGTFNEP